MFLADRYFAYKDYASKGRNTMKKMSRRRFKMISDLFFRAIVLSLCISMALGTSALAIDYTNGQLQKFEGSTGYSIDEDTGLFDNSSFKESVSTDESENQDSRNTTELTGSLENDKISEEIEDGIPISDVPKTGDEPTILYMSVLFCACWLAIIKLRKK
ncbi:hypothetical protein IMSAG049_01688 [Clostridiales bacterium]|nr:hypothetical protein IMSAG049_01688 [Clostridiales bacterium]